MHQWEDSRRPGRAIRVGHSLRFTVIPWRASDVIERAFFLVLFFLSGMGYSLSPELQSGVNNPGFEDDLTDWQTVFDGDFSLASREAARTGTYGLRISDESAEKSGCLQSLPISAGPGQKYEVSFWGRRLSGSGGVRVSLKALNAKGASLQPKTPALLVPFGADWQKFSLAVTSPEETASYVIVIQSLADGMIMADLDDFEFQELPPKRH